MRSSDRSCLTRFLVLIEHSVANELDGGKSTGLEMLGAISVYARVRACERTKRRICTLKSMNQLCMFAETLN